MKFILALLIYILFIGFTMEKNDAKTMQGMGDVYNFVEENLGLNKAQWDLYRNSIAYRESQGNKFETEYARYAPYYKRQGGSNDAYDGRYQLGADAKESGATNFGIKNPGHTSKAREAFLNDHLLQEQLFAGFTVSNYRFMTGNSKYLRQKGKEKFMNTNLLGQMGYLAFGHNSGATNLSKYLAGEITDFKDGNRKSAKIYIDNWTSHTRANTDVFPKTKVKPKPLSKDAGIYKQNLFSYGEI